MLTRIERAIVRWEWLLLLLILPLVLVASPATAPALLLIPLLWLLRKVTSGRFVVPTPLDVALLLLLFMVLISLYATFDIAFSFPKVEGLVYGIALYYAVVAGASRSQRNLWFAVGLFLTGGLGIAAISVLGTQWSTKLPMLSTIIARLPERVFGRPGSTDGFNPNEVAGVLLWLLPLALTLSTIALLNYSSLRAAVGRGRSAVVMLFLLGTTATFAGMLLLTQSRGGFLGFGAALLLLLIIAAGHYRRWLIVTLTFIAITALYLFASDGGTRASELLFEQAAIQGTADSTINTLEGREEIWSRALYGIQDFPFTGMGMNTFRRVVHILYPLFLIAPDQDISHAHNHLLQTALDLGIPGLIAYLALWLGVGALLWRGWHQARSVWLRALAAGLAASFLAYFIYGVTDAVALGARPGFMFWTLVACAVAGSSVTRDSGE